MSEMRLAYHCLVECNQKVEPQVELGLEEVPRPMLEQMLERLEVSIEGG